MGTKVKVKLFLRAKKVPAQSKIELEVENATLKSLLDELSAKYVENLIGLLFDPENNKVRPYYQILVNGCRYQNLLGGLNAKLNDGDVVGIFSPVAGG